MSSRTKKALWLFALAMLLGFVALVLSPGCNNNNVNVLSNTGSIASSNARPMPRQMTTRDLINRGRSR